MLGLFFFVMTIVLIRIGRRGIKLTREITLAESNPRIRIIRHLHPDRMHPRRRFAIRPGMRLKAQQIVVVNMI